MTPDTAAIRARAEADAEVKWILPEDIAGRYTAALKDRLVLLADNDRLRAELAAKDAAVRAYINAMPAQIASARANAQDDLLTRIKKHIRHHFFAKQAIPLWRDISAEVDALRAAAQKEHSKR